jgi:hypothetical protein
MIPRIPLAGALVAAALLTIPVKANDLTIYNDTLTDETQPRGVWNDSAPGFGTSSWESPATGKSNVYFTPDQLFGYSITINDLADITFYTKRLNSEPSDWFLQIYTMPGATGWYGEKFTFDTDTSPSFDVNDNDWNLYSTDTLKFYQGTLNGTNTFDPFSDLQNQFGNLTIKYISLQTSSNASGKIDSELDGLTVQLSQTGPHQGATATVNFEAATPEPSALALLGVPMALLATRLRRRR